MGEKVDSSFLAPMTINLSLKPYSLTRPKFC